MAKILVVGVGDIGGGLAQRLVSAGHQVWGVRRQKRPMPEGVQPLYGDVTDCMTMPNLPKDLDILVYCVAASEFSQMSYHAHYYQGLSHILQALQGQALQRVLFVSSTSVYGQSQGEWVDEDSDACAEGFSGQEMQRAEQLLLQQQWPATVVRFSGIYGPGRTHLIQQVQNGVGCAKESVCWTNRIHRDDCIGVLLLLIEKTLAQKPLHNLYLASDPCPAPLHEVMTWLSERLSKDLQQVSNNVLHRGNRRCSNKRLLELGYVFQYSDYRQGYDALLKQMGLSRRPD